MAGNRVWAAVRHVRKLVESFGPPIVYRKLHGIINALEMQVEDGHYQRHAVAQLCEALLASAELYAIPGESAGRLKELVRGIVNSAES